MKRNYDREMLKVMEEIGRQGETPRLLLHSCCAPCSTVCLERLSEVFAVTVFYYDPNIFPEEEYLFRKQEQIDFIGRHPFPHPVNFIDGDYDTARFYEAVKGHENDPERGERCRICYRLRLGRTAEKAAAAISPAFSSFASCSAAAKPGTASQNSMTASSSGKTFFIAFMFALSRSVALRRFLFLLVVFLVRMWLL